MNSTDDTITQRTYPIIRTLELETSKGKQTVTGFVCGGLAQDKERHRQEFPGMSDYSLRLSDADGACCWSHVSTDQDKLRKPQSGLFRTPVSLPFSQQVQILRINDMHAPTQAEMMEFTNLPVIREAVGNSRYFPFDVKGMHILTPDEWNRLPEEEIKLRSQTITGQVKDKNGKSFTVDFNLQEPLQRILNAGFYTGQSDSGTVSDHPGYRYVEDSHTGNFLKGDLIEPGRGSYLTFWKPEAKVFPHNTARQIEQIVTQAKATGWRVQEMDIFFEPSVRICLPETRDGSTHQELLKEASALMKEQFPHLSLSENMYEWLDNRSIIMKQVIQEHGGEIEWTDREVMKRWTDLSTRLEWAARIDETTGWLTGNDVHSILLTPQESQKLESQLEQQLRQVVESGRDELRIYHERQDRIYDEVAKKYGFASFEENDEGTGVRNYTALGKRANKETQSRLDAFREERSQRMEPVTQRLRVRDERIELMMNNHRQEYLQEVHAITQPRVLARKAEEFKQRISDVAVFVSIGYSPFQYKIRCKIDGRQQSAKLMHSTDGRKELDENEKIMMAAKYFKNELETDLSQTQRSGRRR